MVNVSRTGLLELTIDRVKVNSNPHFCQMRNGPRPNHYIKLGKVGWLISLDITGYMNQSDLEKNLLNDLN